MDNATECRNRGAALLVLIGAFVLLAFHLGSPNNPVFDETFYVNGAKALHSGQPDTNPEHPPLGKLLIGVGIKVFGDVPFGWRIMSAVAGSVTLMVIFMWVGKIADPFTAWIAVVLTVADGFWFVMSRVAMISIFELAFVVIGLSLLTTHHSYAALALGCATACRWNAAFAVALAIAYLLCHREVRQAISVGCVSVLAYTACWIPAIGIRPKAFIQAQLFILHFHRTAAGNPAISVPWYRWATNHEPQAALSYLVANPVVTVAAVIACSCALMANSRGLGKALLIVVAVPVFWLQWAIVGRTFTYYYYFLDTCVFLSIACAVVVGKSLIPRTRLRFAVPIACISVVWFVSHYAAFTALDAPWDTALSMIQF